MSMISAKEISGGQTGVDRGALETALELGFPYGGLVPKGRRSEDGIVPEKFDQTTLDLSVNNPNRVEEKLPTAAECRAKIEAIYKEIGEILRADA